MVNFVLFLQFLFDFRFPSDRTRQAFQLLVSIFFVLSCRMLQERDEKTITQ